MADSKRGKVQVKMLTSRAVPEGDNLNAGDTVSIPAKLADALVKAGEAERVGGTSASQRQKRG